jgi:GNAT superfamily N-acetyltransferase
MSITLIEVKNKKQANLFTEFPNRMYRHVDAFVPALSLDERNVFNPKKNPVHEYCDSIRYLAYQDKKLVGRIGGIINHKINDARQLKQVRFTRLDMIDDIEVTKVLIQAIESWGKTYGCDTIIGPIGFTDLDRQGMLIEGFDQLNMFITIYNHDYYMRHMAALGFIKDAVWVEKKLFAPDGIPDKVSRGAEIARTRYGFRLVKLKKKKEVYDHIYDAFEMYNVAFEQLYGFYPISRKVMDYYIDQMMLLISLEYVWFVYDKENKMAGFGVIMPSLAKANKKSNGHLFPFGAIRLLRSLKHYDNIDLYFIAVDPEHHGKGVIAMMWEDGLKTMLKKGVKFAETGPELENNIKMLNQWKNFDSVDHKRRACYTKPISS